MDGELGRLLDALPGLVWTAHPGGDSEFLNSRWCAYTGIAADEARGAGWRAAIHPDDMPGLAEHWRALGARSEPGDTQVRLRRRDGTYHWFRVRSAPLPDSLGRHAGWCNIGTELEEQAGAASIVSAREGPFQRVVDGVPALVTLMTPDGQLAFANQRIRDYVGMTLEELKGWRASDLVHPDDLPRVMAAWQRALDTGEPYDIEHRLRRADGVYRWFHASALPLCDAEGRVALWSVLQTDVDDRRRAEALLAGEKHLLEMVASGHSLPVVLEALCRLVEESESGYLCSILLVDPGAAVFQHGAAPSLPRTYYASKAGRPAQPESGPCGLVVSEKRQVLVLDVATETRWDASGWCAFALAHGLRSCWSSPILSRSQEVLGTFAIYRQEPDAPTPSDQELIAQLTHFASIAIERARSDAALKRSESFLAEAQSLSRTGSFSWRVPTDEITLSGEVYRILQLDPAMPLTLASIDDRVHAEGIPSLHELIARTCGEGGDFECEHRMLLPDGSVKYLHVVAHGTRDHHGQLEYVGAIQDVTQRRLSEEALDRARAELAHVSRVTSLGALTASIAHEVNQPLSGVITNASTGMRMLTADPPNVDGALETVRRTIRDGHRASEVIARLRALFGNKASVREAVDLNEATREVVALTLSELQRNRVVLRLELADDLPIVIGDRVQLQQVVLNLLLNASEAMSEVHDRPRELVVRSRCDGPDRVRLEVQDAGPGVAPEAMPRLFDAFYSTKSGGMGIGLSVSRSIIERHDGRLVAALNDGPGATFCFSIPYGGEGETLPLEHRAGRAAARAVAV